MEIKDNNKMYDYDKMIKVINSCTNEKQLDCTYRMFWLFVRKYNIDRHNPYAHSLLKALEIKRRSWI